MVAVIKPKSPHWWLNEHDSNLAHHVPFDFIWHGKRFRIDQKQSDGFSYPRIVRALNKIGIVSPFTAGVMAAFVHDDFCKKKDQHFHMWPEGRPYAEKGEWRTRKLSRKERVQIFKDAMIATGRVSKLRTRIYWKVVKFGSKHLGTC